MYKRKIETSLELNKQTLAGQFKPHRFTISAYLAVSTIWFISPSVALLNYILTHAVTCLELLQTLSGASIC